MNGLNGVKNINRQSEIERYGGRYDVMAAWISKAYEPPNDHKLKGNGIWRSKRFVYEICVFYG